MPSFPLLLLYYKMRGARGTHSLFLFRKENIFSVFLYIVILEAVFMSVR